MKMEGLEIVTLPRSVVFSPKSCVSFDCQTGSYFRLFISSAMSELNIYLLNTRNYNNDKVESKGEGK